LLARVDGKSPVEYLDPAEQQRVRDIAMPMIQHAPKTIGGVVDQVADRLAVKSEGTNR
jgi:hypothetical protein